MFEENNTGTGTWFEYMIYSYLQLEDDLDFFINCCKESVWFKVGWGSEKRYFPVYTPFEATLRFLESYNNRFTKFVAGPINFFYLRYNKRIRSSL